MFVYRVLMVAAIVVFAAAAAKVIDLAWASAGLALTSLAQLARS